FAISTFSLVGIPPLNVFYSKLLLFTAYMEFNIGLSVVMVVSSIIALVAYIRVLYKIIWGPEKEIKQISTGTMSGVCLILALIIIAVGLLAPTIYNALISPAASQAMDYNTYIEVVRKLVESFFS
ncbi:MAG: cation:proton antiporter, partial [Thermoprotei archaeon]